MAFNNVDFISEFIWENMNSYLETRIHHEGKYENRSSHGQFVISHEQIDHVN